LKKKNKEDSFLDDIAEEENNDEEMLEENDSGEGEGTEKDNLQSMLSENKESKVNFDQSEEKEILGLSDIEDEDGEFKSPEEIEKSKIKILIILISNLLIYFTF